jgi:hypothetical protein
MSIHRRTSLQGGARPSLFHIALLLAVFLAAVLTQSPNLSHGEARLLWTIRDTVDVRPSSAGDFARAVLQNIRTTLNRADTLTTPYALSLDLWSFIVSDSLEMVRLFSTLCVVIGAALVIRVDKQFAWFIVFTSPVLVLIARQIGVEALIWLLLTLALLLFTRFIPRLRYAVLAVIGAYLLLSIPALSQPVPDWQSVINTYRQLRDPLHPILVGFTPDSPLSYYDDKLNLRQGIAVDLSWRDFTDAELQTIVDRVTQANSPVWLVMGVESPKTQTIISALQARAYTQDDVVEVDGMLFTRFCFQNRANPSNSDDLAYC